MRSFAALVIRRHRALLVAGGLLLVIFVGAAVGGLANYRSGGQDDLSSPSVRARDTINAEFGGQPDLVFLVRARADRVDTGAANAAGQRLTDALRHTPGLTNVESFWAGRPSALAAADHRSALILAHVTGSETDAQDTADTIIDRYRHFDPAIDVRAGGSRGFSHSSHSQIGRSLILAEIVALPIVLVLLVWVFGSLVAASLPLLVALVAIMGALGELALLSRAVDVSTYSVNLTTALGLGLGIDYALLVVTRFRERLAAGDDPPAAGAETIRTAGRTVAFSAATVAVALATLTVFPQYFLRSFAYAGVGVVLLAALAALVLLPALLVTLGHRVDAGRVRRRAVNGHVASARWQRHAQAVARRPVPALLAGVAVLLVIALPIVRASFGTPDDRVLRPATDARVVGDALRSQFTASDSSSIDVVLDDVRSDERTRRVATQIAALPRVTEVRTSVGDFTRGGTRPPTTRGLASGGYRWLRVTTAADPASTAARNLVRQIRGLHTGGRTLVGGNAAALVDVKHSVGTHAAVALPIIVVLSLALLFLLTGSLVQALRALISTALTLTATIGLNVWIFQQGHLSGLLHFTPVPTNLPMTVLLFCVVFGLSMDYEVFVVSRIRESIDAGRPPVDAVAAGLGRTGRIVTAAAVLMAVSFFAFGLSRVSFLQMFGIGCGFAVLVDATVVRGILLPAVSALLGSRGWTTPRPLRGLYQRFRLHEEDGVEAAANRPVTQSTGAR